jgi:DNA-binding transcriptional regulator YiaG
LGTAAWRTQLPQGLVLGGAVLVTTSPGLATEREPIAMARAAALAQQTSAGVPLARASTAIAEVRRLSGLTWDQLARVLRVSRRALHLWASGDGMAAANQERLARVLAVLRQVHRGSSAATRAALFEVGPTGQVAFDALCSDAVDTVLVALGRGAARPEHLLSPSVLQQSGEALRGVPPAILLDTQPEPERERERGRRVRGAKVRRDG